MGLIDDAYEIRRTIKLFVDRVDDVIISDELVQHELHGSFADLLVFMSPA